jgi:hypothetical protein
MQFTSFAQELLVQHIKETGCKIVYDELMRKFRNNCSTRFVFKSKHVIGEKRETKLLSIGDNGIRLSKCTM